MKENELYHSCRILFGRHIHYTRGFLRQLDHVMLKAAYRRKARETHPDMFVSREEIFRLQSAALFRKVTEAYDRLRCYLDERAKERVFTGVTIEKFEPRNFTGQARDVKKYQSFKNFRKVREDGFIFSSTVEKCSFTAGSRIRRLPAEKLRLGDFLYHSGIIEKNTIIDALYWQHRASMGVRRKKFGEYLVRNGIVSSERLNMLIFLFDEHNAKFAA